MRLFHAIIACSFLDVVTSAVVKNTPFLQLQILDQLDQDLAKNNLEKGRLVRVRIYCDPLGGAQVNSLVAHQQLPAREATAEVVASWNRYISDKTVLPHHVAPVVDLLPLRMMKPGALVGVEATAATYSWFALPNQT